MNAIEKLKEIKHYYEMTRQVGHTYGMINGINEMDDCVILVHNLKFGNDLKPYICSKNAIIQSIHSENMLTGMRKPLFIDNAALCVLLTEAFHEIATLESEKKYLQQQLNNSVGFSPP